MSSRTRYTSEPIKAKVIPDFLPPPGKLRRKPAPVLVRYERKGDSLVVTLRPGNAASSDEVTPGLVVERDARGEIVNVRVLKVSKHGADPKALQFSVS